MCGFFLGIGFIRQPAWPLPDRDACLPAGYWALYFWRKNMSFALYMVGFVIFLGGLAWGAFVLGVPQIYIGIGALILLGIGIFSAVSRTRSKDPS